MRKLAVLLLLLVVGCSPAATLDCSSDAAYKDSLKRIVDSMPPEEGKAVADTVATLNAGEAASAAVEGKHPGPHELAKGLNGMTGKEIVADLKSRQDKMNTRGKR